MPRLVSISFTTSPRLPGMHGAPLSFDLPIRTGPLKDWKIALRAETILLRSPPGWFAGQTPVQRRTEEQSTDVTVYEVPREWAALQWSWGDGEQPCEVTEWDEPRPMGVNMRAVIPPDVVATPAVQYPAGPLRRPPPAPLDPEVAEQLAKIEREMGPIGTPKITAEKSLNDGIAVPPGPAAAPAVRKKPGPKPKAKQEPEGS